MVSSPFTRSLMKIFAILSLFIIILGFSTVTNAQSLVTFMSNSFAPAAANDYGDAPDPTYPTLAASNGANHAIGSRVYLGSCVDGDTNGQPNVGATGDDTTIGSPVLGTCTGNDDEDGVTFASALVMGTTANIDVVANDDCTLSAWIDYNADGDWADATESLFPGGQSITVGTNNLTFAVPVTATVGTTYSRFRCTTDGPVSYTGSASDGEVEDYQVTITDISLDFGDAADPAYPTLSANLGASHILANNVFLGSCVDAESDGQPTSTAIGDDVVAGFPSLGTCANNDDEDGVTFTSLLIANSSASIDVTASTECTLSAWIDFNGNGDWSDAGDDIFPGGQTIITGTNSLAFSVPAAAVSGVTTSRFRCTTDGAVSYTGQATDGEVEDHQVLIGPSIDFGDAPDPTYPTLLASDGARHTLGGTLYLGTCVDGEADGQPTAVADGDDTNFTPPAFGSCIDADDEDGISFTSVLAANETASVDVVASEPCTLSAWVDFNANGDWADAGDDIFPGGTAIITGTNSLTFPVSSAAIPGTTTARFRCTTDGSVSYTGLAADGEVEDIQVEISHLDFGDAPDPTYPTLLASNGARHALSTVSRIFLGSCVDAEVEGQPNATATGDDSTVGNPVIGVCSGNDDEDGVTFTSSLFAGGIGQVDVVVGDACTLSAWADWDGNGDWSGTGEDLFPGGQPVGLGTNSLSFAIPGTAVPGTTTARFRCTTDGAVAATGFASDGEVEDYQITIASSPLDYGDIPTTFNIFPGNSSNLARHTLDTNVYMGACIDSESTIQYSDNINGDDLNSGGVVYGTCVGDDDEDGVVFTSALTAGGTTNIDVTVSADCALSAWIDFGRDNLWFNDTAIFSGTPLTAGVNSLSFAVPAGAVSGATAARFRCTTTGAVNYYGAAADGEVEDYQVSIGTAEDFGDAPDPDYPVLAASGGASHILGSGIYLGSCVDGEGDANQSANADGDDISSGIPVFGSCIGADDEDGVTFTSTILTGVTADITVEAATGSTLQAWIDWNADGDWSDSNEELYPGGQVLTAGTNNLNFSVPATATVGTTYAHFRVSSSGTLTPTGQAADGEVEDYKITVLGLDYGDAPDPTYPTLSASNGAQHVITPGSKVFLGSCVDADANGQPSSGANGDDIAVSPSAVGTCVNGDDEDGVTFTELMVPSLLTDIEVIAADDCIISGWADWNADGDWDDFEEDLFPATLYPGGLLLTEGPNTLTFTVTASALTGNTYARLRCTTDGIVPYTGLASDGEVEDYVITVGTAADYGDAPDPTYPTLAANNGPSHLLSQTVYLGTCVDGDLDGQPSANSNGDNVAVGSPVLGGCSAAGDENGVTFLTDLIPGTTANVRVVAKNACTLSGWIDFDANGDWDDAADDLFPGGTPLVKGINNLTVSVPVTAPAGTTAARFRCTTDGPVSYTGQASDGEVEDYQVTIPEMDFGDAPASYPTERSENGAAHRVGGAVYLGTCIDAEADGLTSANADGDDLNIGDPELGSCDDGDEDGVTFTTDLAIGQTAVINISAAAACTLNGWIDWNADGDWEEANESLFPSGQFIPAGSTNLSIFVPVTAVEATTYARFRCTTDGNVSYTGSASNGEVEDYEVTVTALADYGDAPDANYATLAASNGASHLLGSAVYLGNCVDADLDGQPTVSANGDDINVGSSTFGTCANSDDEDGVTFTSLIAPGTTANVNIVANAACTLSGWIDFDADGDWADSGEDLFPGGIALTTGTNNLTFAVPASATTGSTYARFRCTTDGAVTTTGQASDGEVEDHLVSIGTVSDYGDAPDPNFPTLAASSGASHVLGSNVYLGSCVDAELDGQPSANTNGDDTSTSSPVFGTCATGDDEDGVTIIDYVSGSAIFDIEVVANAACTLSAWIDYDANGDWSGAGEEIFPGGAALSAGTNLISVLAPATVGSGMTSARFRCTTDGPVSYTGAASDGEVEDHPVFLGTAAYDFGDAPDAPYPTSFINGGARHTLGSAVYLGSCVDGEDLFSNQSNTNADGDDINAQNPVFGTCTNNDDEDGVTFTTDLIPGEEATIEVVASAACTLSAFVDFNGNGNWTDTGDSLYPTGQVLSVGTNVLTFTVPTEETATSTYARFRCATSGLLTPGGLATDGEVEDYAVTILPLQADLSISKTASSDPVVAGTLLTYTISVNNAGPTAATNIVVTDTLPAEVTFVSTSGCSEDPNGVPGCSLGTLAANATAVYSVTVMVPPDVLGEIDNIVTVKSDTTDGNLGNESVVESTTVVGEADLTITKGDSPDPVIAGETLTYTLSVTNNGPSDALNVVVTDTLPAGVTFVSTYGCAEDPNGVAVCSLGDLALGETTQYTVTVTVDSDTLGPITNNATVGADTTLINTGDDSVAETTQVQAEADLTITKSDSPDPVTAGELLTYTITITNNGPSDALNVQVADTLPAGVTFVSTNGCTEDPNGVPTCTLGTIAASSSAQYTVTVTVDSDTLGTITNNATVSADTTLINTGDDSAAEDTLVEAEADLTITKSDSPDPVIAGDTLTYTLTITNSGPSDALNVVVTDTLPSGVTFVSSTGCTEDPNGVPTCTLGTLAANSSVQYTVTTTVDNDTSGIITNEAVVGSSTTDPNMGDNTAQETTAVLTLDFGDAPDPTYPTLRASDGARHIVGSLRLGSVIDSDADGQPTAVADGDDMDGTDDEDGVTFTTPLVMGLNASVDVVSSGTGLLNVWLDFNGNGDWSDVGEQIFVDQAVSAGTNSLSFAVPGTATAGTTVARFRLDSGGGLTVDGLANDGEVEDHEVTILDTRFSISDVSIDEGNSGTTAFNFTVTRTSNGSAASVDVQTADGTALSSSDYTALGLTTVSFTAGGSLTQTVTISVTGDTLYENDETFFVNVSNPVNGLIDDNQGVGTILNDDLIDSLSINDVSVDEDAGTAVFTVTLSSLSGLDVTVDFDTSDGTAMAGLDYMAANGTVSIPAGSTTITVPVTILDDTLYEGNETFTVTLSSPVNATIADGTGIGTIIDNDPAPTLSINNVSVDESAGTAVFTVTMNVISGLDTDVDYATSDGTAVAGEDYTATNGTLTIPVGSTTGTISVTILDDALYENDETYTVTLSSPVNATIADGTGIGTILDNDPIPEIAFSTDAYQVDEESGSATITVTLAAVSGLDAFVDYDSQDGTATDGSDYTIVSGTLTIPAGQTSGIFTVPILSDAIDEDDETITLSLSNPTNAQLTSPMTATLTIIDNDATIYLPIILNNYTNAPDLIVTDISASNTNIQVVIENRGTTAVVDAFWVDLYINPSQAPTQVNQIWQQFGSYGAVWGVEGNVLPLLPGESMTLMLNDGYYYASLSNIPTNLAVGTPIYAQVDSARDGSDYGNVKETHEINGDPYNNITGPQLSE